MRAEHQDQEVIALSQPVSATPQTAPAGSPPGLLRTGAVCALAGGTGCLALSVAHGNAPSTSGRSPGTIGAAVNAT